MDIWYNWRNERRERDYYRISPLTVVWACLQFSGTTVIFACMCSIPLHSISSQRVILEGCSIELLLLLFELLFHSLKYGVRTLLRRRKKEV